MGVAPHIAELGMSHPELGSFAEQHLSPALAELARQVDDDWPELDLDPESQAWINGLTADGPERKPIVKALRALLLSAVRFEIDRRRASVSEPSDGDADDLAQQCADDALAASLDRLDDYRGDSRFTTWAYKFAIAEASTSFRRLQPSSSRVSSAA